MNLLKSVILILTLCFSFISIAQNEHRSIQLDWSENGKDKNLSYFEGCRYDGEFAIYNEKTAIVGELNYTVQNVTYQSEPLEKKYTINMDVYSLKDEPRIQILARSARQRWSKKLSIFPYFIQNGTIHKVTSVEFDVTEQPIINAKAGIQTFADQSVLRDGNGDWYKIEVSTSGIYKIDHAFLEEMGVDMNSLNPNDINVYGNAQGMLPERNNAYRPDDLTKNAVFIQGDGDNVFNSNDFLLFYAQGPDVMVEGTFGLEVKNNIYSDVSYYFISINPSDTPKRITEASLSVGAATHTISSFQDVKRHELDEVNIGKTGQKWYGEHFDTELTKNYSFTFPNADLGVPFQLRSGFASKRNAGTASMEYFYNGASLIDVNDGGSLGQYQVFSDVNVASTGFTSTSGSVTIRTTYNRSSASNEAWMDFIEIQADRELKMNGGQMNFRNTAADGVGNIGEYFITGSNLNLKVWDVSDPTSVKNVSGNLTGSVYDFKIANDTLKEFVAYNGGQFFNPKYVEKVIPQDLHGLAQAQLLIVTHPSFLTEAVRLADLHRDEDGMSVNVVTTEEIYNEFSSGMQDPTAIKQFTKMFYDRAILDGSQMPVNLCLFGDGTYDPKNRVPGNNYFVPVYEFERSDHSFNSMVVDDYFAILDDNEAIGQSDDLDIGVGRIIVSNNTQATAMVNKIEHYMKNGSTHFSGQDGLNCDDNGFLPHVGDWKNDIVLVADEEITFINECEQAADTVNFYYPEVNINKIYVDAYTQISTNGGQRYPEVNSAIERAVDEGSLFVNYVGHGGETGWALDRILTVPMINEMNNAENLTTILSATCEFCRFDDPTRTSAGEYAYLNEKGAAISLFTTTRSVLYSVNGLALDAFYQEVFEKDGSGQVSTMGELLMNTLNNMGTSNNKRSFTLIGDPALRLSVPQNKVVITHVNGNDISTYTDTLRALDNAKITGYIANHAGVKLNSYNGVVFPSIMDKVKQKLTLGQEHAPQTYQVRENTLYKGKVSVTNGDFEFDFIIPKDIDYAYGFGKISTYSNSDANIEASGGETRVYVGGVNPNGIVDTEGPTIEMYLNSENFANGGTTDETPTLVANVFDENGINTVGNGIGHDITVIIDQNTADQIVLNNYYEADLDTYKSGVVSYKFADLVEGSHTLTFKVWDVNNNSSQETIDFIVAPKEEIKIEHVLNYPNPFTTSTKFFYEHNQVCQSLETQIQIFTVSGKLVKTINELVKTDGFRTDGITWNGRDDFGDKIGRGVYVYRVTVTNPDGSKAEKLEKLVLL